MTFNDLCNRVAKELPDGWRLNIELEQGAGTVELYDRHGGKFDFDSFGEGIESISQAVLEALAFAKQEER